MRPYPLLLNGFARFTMRGKLLIILISLVSFLVWTPARMLGVVQQHGANHRRVHHDVHHGYYIWHRTKLQHAKINRWDGTEGSVRGGPDWWTSGIALVATALLSFRLTFPLPPLKVSGHVQLTNDARAKLWPPDGSRLYYVEAPFVSPVLAQVSPLGGETSAIPTPGESDRRHFP